MKFRVLFVLFFAVLFLSQPVYAQDDKTVSIKVTGSGKTPSEAKQAALRSAIEQAFGTFISAKTDILNDQVVSDQITAVSNGNIQKFDVLNETQLPGGDWATTLNVTVSISKLASFVQSKGVSVEIQGGLFALNIKQQILNEESETLAIRNMMFLLHEPMLKGFDYAIASGEPKSLDDENKSWSIPLKVTVTANKNLSFVSDYLSKNLASISMSPSEVTNYKGLNKPVYTTKVLNKSYFFRKQASLDLIEYFADRWIDYVGSFIVSQGNSAKSGYAISNEFKAGQDFKAPNELDDFQKERPQSGPIFNIKFLSAGAQAAVFTWNDIFTLQEIEKVSGYTVKPAFPMPETAGQIKVGSYYQGGIVFYVDSTGQHGLVASPLDISISSSGGCYERKGIGTSSDLNTGRDNTKSIVEKCEESGTAARLCSDLVANGYGDWFLPSRDELIMLLRKAGKTLSLYTRHQYRESNPYKIWWSSSRKSDNGSIYTSAEGGYSSFAGDVYRGLFTVRPIRAF